MKSHTDIGNRLTNDGSREATTDLASTLLLKVERSARVRKSTSSRSEASIREAVTRRAPPVSAVPREVAAPNVRPQAVRSLKP